MSIGNGEPPKPDAENASASPAMDKETKMATRKIIRVLTVIAYLSSVSMAAIMLSLYYIFLWNPMPTHSARIMPTIPSADVDTATPTIVESTPQTDRMLNRSWAAPEEPRALPVQIAEHPQLAEVAHLHSYQLPANWEEEDNYKRQRGKRAVRSVRKVLNLRPLT